MSTSLNTVTGKNKTANSHPEPDLADFEPDNKVIYKDGNYYYAKKYKNGKKWKKFSEFEELLNVFSKTLSVNAYRPKVEKMDPKKETGRESKFGGTKPFFVKGEKWPTDVKWDYKTSKNGPTYYMTFFGQFIDPRKKDKMLYRIFILIDDNDINDRYWITKIELNEENLKNQIIIEKPKYPEGFFDKYSKEEKFEPYKITGWTKFKELGSFDMIRTFFHINPYKYGDDNTLYNGLQKAFYDHDLAPASGVKVGGTPLSTQDQDFVQNYDLIQIEETSYLPYMWGDAGIAHVSEDLEFTWDCC